MRILYNYNRTFDVNIHPLNILVLDYLFHLGIIIYFNSLIRYVSAIASDFKLDKLELN